MIALNTDKLIFHLLSEQREELGEIVHMGEKRG